MTGKTTGQGDERERTGQGDLRESVRLSNDKPFQFGAGETRESVTFYLDRRFYPTRGREHEHFSVRDEGETRGMCVDRAHESVRDRNRTRGSGCVRERREDSVKRERAYRNRENTGQWMTSRAYGTV